jgi:micrococcal nuclease
MGVQTQGNRIMIERTFEYYGYCTRVIDGDTIEVYVDMGFEIHHKIRVRLLNVLAPELFSGPADVRVKGKVARDYLDILLRGRYVKIQTVKDHTTFNRYIATVWVDEPDDFADSLTGVVNVNEEMTRYINENNLNG